MLIQPDDDVDLRRQLAGKLVKIVQGLLQGRAANDNGVHHDLLGDMPPYTSHITLYTLPATVEAVSSQRLLTAGTTWLNPDVSEPARFFMCPGRSVCLHSHQYPLSVG